MNPYGVVSEPNPSGDPGFCCSNYRQIRYEVFADSTVTPDLPMYCDVYINDVYYKTHTSYTIENSGSPFFLGYYWFDIQDSLQEFLSTFIQISKTLTTIENTSVSGINLPIATVQCFFRGSTITGGILTPGGPVPIQATSTTPAVNGDKSYASNAYLVLNSSITPGFQNIYSNDLEDKLKEKHIVVLPLPHARVYPLSNFPSINNFYIIDNIPIALRTFAKDNGQFPFIIQEFGASGILSNWFRNCQVILLYWDSTLVISGSVALTPSSVGLNAGFTYYVPFGLKDILACPISGVIKSLLVNPNNNMYYCVGLLDDDAAAYCAFTPLVYCGNKSVEDVRIWFQNVYGHFDQITFIRNEEKFSVTSGEQFTTYDETIKDEQFGSFTSLNKGKKRYNVRSEDELSLYVIVTEKHMDWMKELFSSPYILMQTDYTTSGYTQMEIIDDTFQTKKKLTEAGIKYQVTVKMKPSIPLIQLRN